MSEQAQVGDMARVSFSIKGVVAEREGRLFVGSFWLDDPTINVEVVSRATPPLPSEPGTLWLDRDGEVWQVENTGYLCCLANDGRWLPADRAPFRQLVLK